MRFRAQLEVWLDASSADEAESILEGAMAATLENLGPAAVPNAVSNALCQAQLEADNDDAALESLLQEDMGPGRTVTLFRSSS